METVGVIIGILVLLGLFFWAAKSFNPEEPESRRDRFKELIPGVSELFKLEHDKYKQTHEQAPYKLEPPEPAEQLAIPVTTLNPLPKPERKRKYTKRSTYWTSSRVKTKMRKARKARKSSKSK